MSLQNAFQSAFNQYRSQLSRTDVRKSLEFMEARMGSELVPYKTLQSPIRAMYGKSEPCEACIGDHPDFEYLKDSGGFCYHPITTLFMDIESSTRLSLLYNLEDVFRIKNGFIRAAMEVIKAFDGHVHRIMGDAVMAYFGGKSVKLEDTVVDALNCASMLIYFTKRALIPLLESEGYGGEFGIRIGIDYGSKEDVLWSCYGYPNMSEVTATSFYVDVASKLQHAAGRNQIMIGQSLWKFIDFPEDLLDYKTVLRDGKETQKPYLEPNHTDREGKPINYSQRILNWEKYLRCSPLAMKDREFLFSTIRTTSGIPVRAEVYTEQYGTIPERQFVPTGFCLPKQKWIKFMPFIPHQLRYPFKVHFVVENHGEDALDKAGTGRGNHDKTYTINNANQQKNLTHWENTQYRGLHYLIIKVEAQSGIVADTTLGVYID